jgi:sporulation protein YlmC with PRC-barrel domain
MRIDLDARVVNKDGAAVGRLHEIVFDRESRRVAGFLVVTGEVAPREVFVMVGQVAQIEQDRLELALSDEEVVALPDARQHLFVAPGQDLDAEIAAAESPTASPEVPDPDERPRFSAIPGFALTPNLFIPLEVERTILDEEQIALGAGLRILTAAGEEVGQLGGVVVNDEAQLEGLVLAGGEDQIIDFTLLDELDEDANELTLRNDE